LPPESVILSAKVRAVNGSSVTRTRVFTSKAFSRFARRSRILEDELCETVRAADRGLIAADLGGGVIKQRIARRGEGKSGGFRVLILFRSRRRAIFIHGFAKNEQDNIRSDELEAFKRLAAEMLGYSDFQLKRAVESGTLIEVVCRGNGEAIS